MKLSILIQAIDRVTAPVKKITGGISRLTKATKDASRATDQLGRSTTSLPYRLGFLLGSVARLAGRGGLGALKLSAKAATAALAGTIRMAGRLAATGIALGVGAASYLTGGVIGLAGQFEQFQVTLEGTEGSAAKAKAAMKWVRNFAKETPYEVAGVTDAFVRMRGVGIDPMTGALRILGDAAGGARKELMDAVEAIADAQTGEFERLKSFNVTTSVKGDKVTFSYLNKAGKNATRTVKKDMASIQKAVLAVFDEKYAGGMIRQSRTLFGIWNNIKDMISGFQLDVADAGFFDFVKGQLQQLLDKVNQLAANGTLQRWAKQVSDWLIQAGKSAMKFIQETDWRDVADTVKTVAVAVWTLAKALAFVVKIASGVVRVLRELAGLMPEKQSWGYQIRQSLGLVPNEAPRPVRPVAPRRGLRPGPAVPTRSMLYSDPARRPAAQVGGRIDLHIQTDRGTTAKVTRMSSTNRDVPIDVTRGRVMAA